MIYLHSLDDLQSNDDSVFEYTTSVNVNDLQCDFTFKFPEYEYYDLLDLKTQLTNAANADPMVVGQTYIRDYDWLNYYLNDVEVTQDWLEGQGMLPNSLYSKVRDGDIVGALSLLETNVVIANEIKDMLDLQEQVVRWWFKLEIGGELVCSGYVQKGGVYEYQNNIVRFMFVSDYADDIGFDDLHKCAILFNYVGEDS